MREVTALPELKGMDTSTHLPVLAFTFRRQRTAEELSMF